MTWRPRFSLRTLVVFLLLVTSGVGLWWHWEPWRRTLYFSVAGRPIVAGRPAPEQVSVAPDPPADEDDELGDEPVLPAWPDYFRAESIGFTENESQLEAIWFQPVEDIESTSDTFRMDYEVRTFDVLTGTRIGERPGEIAKGKTATIRHHQVLAQDGRRAVAEPCGQDQVTVAITDSSGKARLAELGPFHVRPGWTIITLALSSTGTRLAVVEKAEMVHVYRRRRPEWWWGVFWLWEFWLTVAFAGLFAWSIVRDRRALGKREAE